MSDGNGRGRILAAALIRRRRLILLTIVIVAVLAAAGLLGAGCYYSELLKDGALEPDREPDELDLEVVAVGDDRITLRATSRADEDGDWRHPGTFGLQCATGYGQVGAVLEEADHQVIRQFRPIAGTPSAGEPARLDSFAFPEDPAVAHGIPFEDVAFSGELGDFPAWFVEGFGNTWAIFVHGKGANRREALRLLPVFHRLEVPSLVITYRNDEEAPASADGYYRYGETEWEDLASSVEYAIGRGAERFVLVGYSMGGGIVASFLLRSPLAGRVVGAILDSPMLALEAIIDQEARNRGAPGVVAAIGKTIAAWRFDIHWDDVDYLSRAEELKSPILLFHGEDDSTVFIETSDALAEKRPDIVTYYRASGVGHVRSWNADPAAYEGRVRQFVEPLLARTADAQTRRTD